jgi:hypothetical protein
VRRERGLPTGLLRVLAADLTDEQREILLGED